MPNFRIINHKLKGKGKMLFSKGKREKTVLEKWKNRA